MHICFVTLGFAPQRMSGLDISGERLVRKLLMDGHQITLIAGQKERLPEVELHPQLRTIRVPIGASNWIGWALRAARAVRTVCDFHSCDVVHFWDIHFAYAFGGDFVASLQHSFRQRSDVLRFKGGGNIAGLLRGSYYAAAQYALERPTLKRARGLLAGSAATFTEYDQNYGVDPGRIALARHGIDTNFFRHSSTGNLRQKYGLRDGDRVILFAGFVTPRKGMRYLAEALAGIQTSLQLIVLGQWKRASQEQFNRMLNSSKHTVTYAGFVPDSEMPRYYSMADVYASASLLEGFGLPLIEALACETPVVATTSGAAPEVVGPGGILVPPGDSAKLGEAISVLLESSELRRSLGLAGRDHVTRWFSWETMASSTLAAYKRFLGC